MWKFFFSLSVQLLLTTTNKFISIYCTVFAKKKRRKIFEIQSWNGKLHLQKFTQQLVSVNHCDCLQRTKKKKHETQERLKSIIVWGRTCKTWKQFFFLLLFSFFYFDFIYGLSVRCLPRIHPLHLFFFGSLGGVNAFGFKRIWNSMWICTWGERPMKNHLHWHKSHLIEINIFYVLVCIAKCNNDSFSFL